MATSKSQLDIIKRFMKSLDMTNLSGEKALNQAVNYASGGYFSDFQTAVDKMAADCKKLGADKFLLQKCGINLNNTDTGAITGLDAGGKKTKTAKSIVPESGNLDTTFKATSFETNGLTFRLSQTSLSNNEVYMWRALKTWWAQEGLNLIEESFGYSFNDSDATVKEINVVFKNAPSGGYFAYVDPPTKVNGRYAMTLNINKAVFKSFSSGDVDGKSTKYPSNYLDRTIAHELTHAVMMAKVNNYNYLPRFITEGIAELTRGIDDLRADVIKTLAKDSSKLKKFLNTSSTSTSTSIYAAGYIFLRYLAKRGAQNYSAADTSDSVTVKSTTLTLNKNFSAGTLDLDDYSAKVKTVKAGALTKGIVIYGNSLANSIVGGTGADTISGGKGNDTLTGGKGADIFIYSEGNDIITDWTASDRISLTAAVSKTTLDGSDVVFTVGNGSLTVKDGKGKTLNVITSSGKQYSTVLGGTTLTLTNVATSPVTVNSSLKEIDASTRTKAINITGNDKANTLTGGKGNDTLTGGNGSDIFIYTAGNDIITDYVADDKISLGAAISKTTLDGSDVVFTTDKGSLTVKDGKGKTLNVIASSGKKYSTVLGGTTLTLTNAANSPITVDSAIKKIDASTRTKAINITSNAKANSIVGGTGNDCISGGKGNDSISGGAGNDSLWGDAGNDTFIYAAGDGDDIIFGFQDGDTLTLDNLKFKTSYSAKNNVVKFTFDDGSVTLKDFTAKTFHVNNAVYQISGSKFVKS